LVSARSDFGAVLHDVTEEKHSAPAREIKSRKGFAQRGAGERDRISLSRIVSVSFPPPFRSLLKGFYLLNCSHFSFVAARQMSGLRILIQVLEAFGASKFFEGKEL